MLLEADFFFPCQTVNSSFKLSINLSSIAKSYPGELVTHAFFKPVSKLNQQHSQKLFCILWISNTFQNCKTSPVLYFCRMLRSAWEQFWPDTCGMLQQQKVQDKKSPQLRGNIYILSVHTDKYSDLEGVTLCLRKVAVSGMPAESWGSQTIVPPVCCNSRTLLLQITPLHFLLVQKQTPTPLQTRTSTLNLQSPKRNCILQTTLKKLNNSQMWHRRLEIKSHLSSISNTPVEILSPTSYTVTAT